MKLRSATRWALACGMLALSGVAAYLASEFIAWRFPVRPQPRDLLFEALPRIESLRYAADVAVLAALVILLVHVLRERRERLPGMIAAFAVFYALRAVVVMLTPLGLAHGEGDYFALLPIHQYGDLSGHAGAALLCFLFVDATGHAWLRRTQLALVVIEAVALVMSHSHYSFDVVAGLLLAYFVWREWSDGRLLAPLRRVFEPGAGERG